MIAVVVLTEDLLMDKVEEEEVVAGEEVEEEEVGVGDFQVLADQ